MSVTVPCFLRSILDYQRLLDDYDTWMFDCDGVLWTDNVLTEGASEVLKLLRSNGKRIIFVTNNPTLSRERLKVKFDRLGVQADVDEIFSSAYASAVYISSVMKLPKDKKVYLLGMSGIEEELREQGITTLGGTDPSDNTLQPFDHAGYIHDPSVAVVLCSYDGSMNHTKLSKAFQYLTRNPGCEFFASDGDVLHPVGKGMMLLGSPAVSAPLSAVLGREPITFGKPSQAMFSSIQAKHNLDPTRTIMVGDRLNTDVQFGKNSGLSTLLVLTGVTQPGDLDGTSTVPDFVTDSIGDFRILLQ